LEAFIKLKETLTTAPILHPFVWEESFELICDASKYAIGFILGQQIGKEFHMIHYASHALNDNQMEHTVTEKRLFSCGIFF